MKMDKKKRTGEIARKVDRIKKKQIYFSKIE